LFLSIILKKLINKIAYNINIRFVNIIYNFLTINYLNKYYLFILF